MKSTINWFEIHVADMDRATRFYERMLDVSLKRELFGGLEQAIFPHPEQGTGGALVLNPKCKPSGEGTVVYLDATGKLDACIERAKSGGGKVLMPKTDIGDPGYIALVADSEGNSIGLHAPRENARNTA